MRGIVKKISNIMTTIIIVTIVILAILLAGVRLFGVTPYMVLSGSMEPTYHVGSLIYIVKADATELKKNDPVTYKLDGGTVVTHRIVEVILDEGNPAKIQFRTKGDANKEPDGSLLPAERVIGKPLFCIPFLGYVANFVQTPPGIYIVEGVCVTLLLLFAILDLVTAKKNQQSE